MELSYSIEGMDELLKKVDGQALLGQPLRTFFNKASLETQRQIQQRTPADTAVLRAGINTEVDSASVPQYARIGSNSNYAMFVEYDTKPHWPPIAAITPWAERHGIDPYMVARGIAAHGTKGAHMFEFGLEAAKGRFPEFLSELGSDIEGAWGK
jgi:hypothetical protein